MQEFIKNIRAGLDTWGKLAAIILNALSLFCIVAGVIISLANNFKKWARKQPSNLERGLWNDKLQSKFRYKFKSLLMLFLIKNGRPLDLLQKVSLDPGAIVTAQGFVTRSKMTSQVWTLFLSGWPFLITQKLNLQFKIF